MATIGLVVFVNIYLIFLRNITLANLRFYNVIRIACGESRNGGREICQRSSSQGRQLSEDFSSNMFFPSGSRNEPGQVCLAVEASLFAWLNCIIYIPNKSLYLEGSYIPNKSLYLEGSYIPNKSLYLGCIYTL